MKKASVNLVPGVSGESPNTAAPPANHILFIKCPFEIPGSDFQYNPLQVCKFPSKSKKFSLFWPNFYFFGQKHTSTPLTPKDDPEVLAVRRAAPGECSNWKFGVLAARSSAELLSLMIFRMQCNITKCSNRNSSAVHPAPKNTVQPSNSKTKWSAVQH